MYVTDFIRIQVLIVAAGRVKRVQEVHASRCAVARWLHAQREIPHLAGPFFFPRPDRRESAFQSLCVRLLGRFGPSVTDPRAALLPPHHRIAIESFSRGPLLWEPLDSPQNDNCPLRSTYRHSMIPNIGSNAGYGNWGRSFRVALGSVRCLHPGVCFVRVVLHHIITPLILTRRHRGPPAFAFVPLDLVPVAAVLGSASPRGPPGALSALVARPVLFPRRNS